MQLCVEKRASLLLPGLLFGKGRIKRLAHTHTLGVYGKILLGHCGLVLDGGIVCGLYDFRPSHHPYAWRGLVVCLFWSFYFLLSY